VRVIPEIIYFASVFVHQEEWSIFVINLTHVYILKKVIVLEHLHDFGIIDIAEC
jgi:hypothetical protein